MSKAMSKAPAASSRVAVPVGTTRADGRVAEDPETAQTSKSSSTFTDRAVSWKGSSQAETASNVTNAGRRRRSARVGDIITLGS